MNQVRTWVVKPDGAQEPIYTTHNMRTNVGAAWLKERFTLGTAAGAAIYVAVSADTATVAAGDTILYGELSSGGLSRATGAVQNYSEPVVANSSAQYEVVATYSVTSTTTLLSAGIFTAASGGSLVWEANFANGQQVVPSDTFYAMWTVRF